MSVCCEAPEVWRPIPGHPGYEASSRGRVRNVQPRYGGEPYVLKPFAHTRGYLKINLGSGARNRLVHRLIAAAFHGERSGSLDADHRDWDKTHNCAVNLRWLSRREHACRWHETRPDGRILWNINHELDAEALEGYEPMTEQEAAEVAADLERAGWTVAS